MKTLQSLLILSFILLTNHLEAQENFYYGNNGSKVSLEKSWCADLYQSNKWCKSGKWFLVLNMLDKW